MVDNLWLHRRTDARDKLYQDIWARENPFPTVVGSGFAIPCPNLCCARLDDQRSRLVNPVTWRCTSGYRIYAFYQRIWRRK
jgi:fructose-specific PTS system IIA-like component